jgi:hypothetical protein
MKSALAPADVDSLMTGLEVEFVKVVECLVSPGVVSVAVSHSDRVDL